LVNIFLSLSKYFLSFIESFSNWGKWGIEDELGTVNFITPQVRKEALQTVQEGVSVSCSRLLEFFSKSPDTTYQATRFMLESGDGRENEDEHCNSVHSSRRAVKEQISFVFHGYTITHLDSLSHFSWKGKMYNNRSCNLVSISQGSKKNSIESLKNGILTRGVLLDIAELKSKQWLENGEPVTREDLENAEKKFQVKVCSGDVLLVRTGYYGRRKIQGPSDPTTQGVPGPHPSILPFLKEREVSIFGSDTPNDIQPPLYEQLRNPIHIVSLVSLGLPLLDNANLEELSKFCQKFQRYYFLIQINPLFLEATSGSPVNPIATF